MKNETSKPILKELEDLRREVRDLRRCSAQTIAKMLQLDARSVAIRHELEQKRRGFSLMADLAVTLGQEADYESLFVSSSRRINAALNMQRTAMLVPDESGKFKVSVLQGYSSEEKAKILSEMVPIPEELLNPIHPVLVTGADPAARLATVREALMLPFFISAPVFLHNEVVAILVTGRKVEEMPFFPRLNHSDLDTVQTVSAYLAAVLTGHRLRQAETLANFDPLTQLPNLRGANDRLRDIIGLAHRERHLCAIMFIDLDGFKNVNDTLGHAAGDIVLREVAERLMCCVRESDLIGRIGGDEFVMALSRLKRREDAGAVAAKIIAKVSEPIDVLGTACRISASIGIAIFPDHGGDETTLLHAADEAMYKAKKNGKNGFCYARR